MQGLVLVNGECIDTHMPSLPFQVPSRIHPPHGPPISFKSHRQDCLVSQFSTNRIPLSTALRSKHRTPHFGQNNPCARPLPCPNDSYPLIQVREERRRRTDSLRRGGAFESSPFSAGRCNCICCDGVDWWESSAGAGGRESQPHIG